MPRRDRSEDDDSDRPRPTTGSNTVLVVLAAVGVVCFVLIVGCGGFLWFGMRGIKEVAEDEKAAAEARDAKAAELPTREQFDAKWVGKTKDEVLAGLGKPDATNKAGPSDFWMYRNRTRDAATGKVYFDTTLWFDDHGRVERVTHQVPT